MQKSKAFGDFFEILPMFPPTYRFIVGSCCYDLKYVFTVDLLYIPCYIIIIINKIVFRRRPAWTDRILYKTIDPSNKKCVLKINSYKHIESLQLSDHKPVYCESSIMVIRLKYFIQIFVFILLILTGK